MGRWRLTLARVVVVLVICLQFGVQIYGGVTTFREADLDSVERRIALPVVAMFGSLWFALVMALHRGGFW